MLELENITNVLCHSDSSYIKDKHYKKIIRPNECNPHSSSNESNNPERIYLNYFGLVKMLITRRHPIA